MASVGSDCDGGMPGCGPGGPGSTPGDPSIHLCSPKRHPPRCEGGKLRKAASYGEMDFREWDNAEVDLDLPEMRGGKPAPTFEV